MLKPKMLKQSKKVSFFKKMMPHKEIIIDQYGVPNSGKNNTQIKKPRKIAIRVPVKQQRVDKQMDRRES